MNYQQTLEWLFVQLPMYQKQGAAAYKKDLSNTILLAKYLNNPHEKFKTVHVAGTNGKGSCSHMLASVLQQGGYKVGLYTSPHLVDFRERIKINGVEIPEQYVVDFVKNHRSFFEANNLSFFEMTVGLAFDYFASEKVDIAVVEVGLGGRLDSTNIISPEVGLITNIGLDHTQFLGDTLQLIATEKGGIIKDTTPIVIGEYHKETFPVFKKLAQNKNAMLYKAFENQSTDFKTDLLGSYQLKNVQSVVKTLEVLQTKGFELSEPIIKTGLLNVVKNTRLLGRWQVLQEQPKVICDTAHNKEGLTYTMVQLQEIAFTNLHLVLGMVSDKDLSSILPLFPKNATYYFCKPNIGRALDATVLAKKALAYSLKGGVYSSVKEAYKVALQQAKKTDCIYIGGSTFVVAEIL